MKLKDLLSEYHCQQSKASVESLCHRDVLGLDKLGLFSVSQELSSDKIRTECTTKRWVLLRQRLEMEYIYSVSVCNNVDKISCDHMQQVWLGYSVALHIVTHT